MPFLLLVFLALACLPEPGKDWPEPPWGAAPWLAVVLTVLTVLISTLYAALLSRRVRLTLSPDYHVQDAELNRYERGRARHQYLLFGLYALALLVFGWGDAVGRFWRVGDRLLPFAELMVLAPFFASMLLSWLCFYDAERAQWSMRHLEFGIENALFEREGTVESGAAFTSVPHPALHLPDTLASRWSYLLYQARQRLALVSIPLGLLLGQKELARLVPEEMWQRREGLMHLLGLVLVLAAFATMPWIIRLVLGLMPLPDSSLKRRLLATARRLRFRCSSLLLWNTRRGMANAMVVGLLPWPRYVIFTDRLLEEFSADEVEAVLGHEIGHIRHRHLPFYLAFLLASIVVLVLTVVRFVPGVALADNSPAIPVNVAPPAAGDVAEPASSLTAFFTLRHHPYLKMVPPVGAMLVYIFVVFGFLSRRCERQADVFGCRAVSCTDPLCLSHDDGRITGEGRQLCRTGIRTFIQALDKVALVNGLSREKPGILQSWQHSTIAKRVAFLQRLLDDTSAERSFQRHVLLVKCGLLGLLGLLAAALFW